MKQTLILFLFFSMSIAALAQGAGVSNGEKAANALTVSTVEEFQTEFTTVPCKNEARLDAVKALFMKVGAPADAVVVDDYSNVKNLVVTLAGQSEEKIVIGAHYDLAGDGSCGAIDNWTGIVTLAHLYRTFKPLALKKTILFVAFGKEEGGLVGSRAMADSIHKRKENDQYCAMVNIDSLGLTAPQVLDSMSSKPLADFAEAAAKEIAIPYSRLKIEGADSDSSSFKARKIPAVTLAALPENWMGILHSKNDQAKYINPVSVYAGYRWALVLVAKIQDGECLAFREVKKPKQ